MSSVSARGAPPRQGGGGLVEGSIEMRNDYVGPEPKRSIAAAELFNLFACCYLQVLWDLPPFPPSLLVLLTFHFSSYLSLSPLLPRLR